MRHKEPVSVLVIVYTPELDVLLIERADFPDHWQSVTGSIEAGETLAHAAARDWHLSNVYEIFPQWRHRYRAGTTHNTEHVFGLEVPGRVPITLAPREHLRHEWLGWREAAARCFSWSNRAAIEALPEHTRTGTS